MRVFENPAASGWNQSTAVAELLAEELAGCDEDDSNNDYS